MLSVKRSLEDMLRSSAGVNAATGTPSPTSSPMRCGLYSGAASPVSPGRGGGDGDGGGGGDAMSPYSRHGGVQKRVRMLAEAPGAARFDSPFNVNVNVSNLPAVYFGGAPADKRKGKGGFGRSSLGAYHNHHTPASGNDHNGGGENFGQTYLVKRQRRSSVGVSTTHFVNRVPVGDGGGGGDERSTATSSTGLADGGDALRSARTHIRHAGSRNGSGDGDGDARNRGKSIGDSGGGGAVHLDTGGGKLYTESQVQDIVAREVATAEQRLRGEYDTVLAEKLEEQYRAFVKYNEDYISMTHKDDDFSYIS